MASPLPPGPAPKASPVVFQGAYVGCFVEIGDEEIIGGGGGCCAGLGLVSWRAEADDGEVGVVMGGSIRGNLEG